MDEKVVTVQIDDQQPEPVSLNLNDKLSKTRERLKLKEQKIKMNDILSFAIKISFSNSAGNPFARIIRGDEEKTSLGDIVEEKSEKLIFLYLISPDYNFLKNKFELEYGRTISSDQAEKRAFKRAFTLINDYGTIEVIDKRESKFEIDPKESQIMKKDLDTSSELSIRSNVINHVIEYSKVKFKLENLEPTTEFINAVEDAMESKDLRKIKKITEEFGQFIPKEVILGGRAENAIIQNSKIKTETKSSKSTISSSDYKGFKLLGGKYFGFKEFNEMDWSNSLNDFRNWDCIKIEKQSIFKPLHEDLRKKILSFAGKTILYISTKDYDYYLPKSENYKIVNLEKVFKLKEENLEILRNKDADCSIFATVIDRERMKNDIFNCMILWPPEENPELIIHCIRKKFRERKCKLRIMLMIVGYNINFNFDHPDFNIQLDVQKKDINSKSIKETLDLKCDSSYCFGIPILRRKLDVSNNSLIGHYFFSDGNERIETHIFSYSLKEKRYINLPDFTFNTLIVSDYSSNHSGILPLKHNIFNILKSNLFDILFKHNSLNPKYISLYSTKENYSDPIFLKQKFNGIKVKHLNIYRDRKNKPSKKPKNNLEYAYFDPNEIKFNFLHGIK